MLKLLPRAGALLLAFVLMVGMVPHMARAADAPPATPAPTPAPAAKPNPADGDPNQPYTVIDGKVDNRIARGYLRYHSYCYTCHGFYANGSSFAPALKDSLKTMTYEQFLDTVANGRHRNTEGNQAIMPSFGFNNDVMNHIDDIYAYIKARSDGAVKEGRPTKIGEEPQPE